MASDLYICDIDITRGALRALALAAATPPSLPDRCSVTLDGDHRGMATKGHIAVLVEPVEPDECETCDPVHVLGVEALRLRPEASHRGDVASVSLRGETLRISVPTEVAAEGQQARRRVEVISVVEDITPTDWRPLARPALSGLTLCTLAVDVLSDVLAIAKSAGCSELRLTREHLDDPHGVIGVHYLPDGNHEHVRGLLMPMVGDGGITEAPEDRPEQTAIPGTEARPSDLTAYSKRAAIEMVRVCVSVSTLEAWRTAEQLRGEEMRPAVCEAIGKRIGELV